MQKTPAEPVHTLFIPDRSHIVSDIGIGRGDVLCTLEEAIGYNKSCTSPSDLKIELDAFEDGRFIHDCASAIEILDKTDPKRASELALGLQKMLDEAGLQLFATICRVAEIFEKKDKQ